LEFYVKLDIHVRVELLIVSTVLLELGQWQVLALALLVFLELHRMLDQNLKQLVFFVLLANTLTT
jgi:hypothetical protein